MAGFMDKMRDRASGRSNVLSTDASCLLDTQAQRILDTWSRLVLAPYELLTLEQARQQPSLVDAAMEILQQDGRPTDPEVIGSAADVTVPGPGGDLVVRVYKPLGQTLDSVPVVMWVHGGGWILFTNDDYDASCRALVNRTGAIVVSPEYRKAPEHVFPAAHEDVLATYRWLRTNAIGLGGDPSRIAIGGEGVGANMAAATCGQLKQAGEPLPAGAGARLPADHHRPVRRVHAGRRRRPAAESSTAVLDDDACLPWRDRQPERPQQGRSASALRAGPRRLPAADTDRHHRPRRAAEPGRRVVRPVGGRRRAGHLGPLRGSDVLLRPCRSVGQGRARPRGGRRAPAPGVREAPAAHPLDGAPKRAPKVIG